MKKFKPGWYCTPPYSLKHFFHTESKSVCGITATRDNLYKPRGAELICGICQNGTGKKP